VTDDRDDRDGPPPPPPSTPRREHKARTRQALIDAALELFAAKGYDATATEEIAARAGVSPRTFFRYFETKDRVLFFGGEDFNRLLIEELPDQPAGRSDLEAVEATLVTLAPELAPLRTRIHLYFQALATSTTLVGQHATAQAAHEQAVALALARRRGLEAPDERCRVAAGVASLVTAQAWPRWLAEPPRDLADLLREGFALVRAVASAST
jgi:AcrR family transcriptional regulator